MSTEVRRTVPVKLDVPDKRRDDLHGTVDQFLYCANRTSDFAWHNVYRDECVTSKSKVDTSWLTMAPAPMVTTEPTVTLRPRGVRWLTLVSLATVASSPTTPGPSVTFLPKVAESLVTAVRSLAVP